MQDRAYMKSFLDDCSMGNWFESKIDKCQVSSAAVQTLIKGEPVIAKFNGEMLALTPEEEETRKQREAQAQAAASGNAESPTE